MSDETGDQANGSDAESPAEHGSGPAPASGEGRARGSDGPDPASDPDYTPSPDDDFEVIWAHLSENQRKYVLSRQSHTKKAYAAEAVDLHRDTVYSWPDYVEAASRKLVDKQKDEIAYALQKLEHKGIRELERLLDEGDDERTRLEAIRTVLNRNRGKPTRKTEVDVDGGIDINPDDEDAIDDALGHLGDEE